MIIGLEWIIIALGVAFLILWILGCSLHGCLEKLSTVLVSFALACEVGFVVLSICIIKTQTNIEEQYMDYLKLQTRVAQYDDLDMLEQYEVSNDVTTYNLWYERNKSDLENPWTLKGTSSYAKEFNYIVIGD
jgi:hypothetical protein